MALQGLLCPIDSFLSFVARFVSSRLWCDKMVCKIEEFVENNKATFFKFKVVQLLAEI